MTVGRVVALSIAGFDSGAGAGILADCKTFEAFGVWGTAALTAVTAQNTLGVQAVGPLDAGLVAAQIRSVATDFSVAAVKIGMLGNAEIVAAVADAVSVHGLGPVVVDPVALSSSGTVLLDHEGLDLLIADLVPLAEIVTPNLAEAAAMTGLEVRSRPQMEEAGAALVARGCRAALVTGGHLDGNVAADCLVVAGRVPIWLESRFVVTATTHGTGCVLSAAICAGLARGVALEQACRDAKTFVTRAIRGGVSLGTGPGSLDPGAVSWPA